jgi:lysophospholipase L1-like esterase
LGWERLPNYQGPLGNDFGSGIRRYDSQGFQAYDTAQVADRTTPRILVIGDSSTYGWGVPPEASYAEVLDRALPSANVINLGMLGYSSFQGYRTLVKYGDKLQPSMIVASFNYNDRRFVLNRNVDSEEKFASYAHGQHAAGRFEWIKHVYMARILRWIMRKIGLIKPDPVLDRTVFSLEARVPPESYRENLRQIAEYGRARNIPVVFLLLKDNPFYTDRLRAGIQYRESGQYDRAVRAFTIGLSNGISGTLARKYLVQTYGSAGAKDKAAALAHIDLQREHMDGGSVIYLDSEYNKIMIDVAQEFGLKIVDARPMLDANPEVFLDMCHPDAVGHAHIAELLLQTVKQVAPNLAKGAANTASDKSRTHHPIVKAE